MYICVYIRGTFCEVGPCAAPGGETTASAAALPWSVFLVISLSRFRGGKIRQDTSGYS